MQLNTAEGKHKTINILQVRFQVERKNENTLFKITEKLAKAGQIMFAKYWLYWTSLSK